MGLPASDLEGVWDVAVFDINGDGWNDLVLGRCSGTQVYINVPPAPPAGQIEVVANPSTQLLLAKNEFGAPSLSWGASCVGGDTDYASYSGSVNDIGNHAPYTCSTGGATTHTVFLSEPNSYYLVVPHNQVLEGSYGTNSDGGSRPVGSPPCRVQYVAECASE